MVFLLVLCLFNDILSAIDGHSPMKGQLETWHLKRHILGNYPKCFWHNGHTAQNYVNLDTRSVVSEYWAELFTMKPLCLVICDFLMTL